MWVEVACEGDATGYTWTYSAELSFIANFVTVSFDDGSTWSDVFELAPVDGERALWEKQVTELLSSKDCDTVGVASWEAMDGTRCETTESDYP